MLGGCSVGVHSELVAFLHFLWPSRTLVMKVTMVTNVTKVAMWSKGKTSPLLQRTNLYYYFRN